MTPLRALLGIACVAVLAGCGDTASSTTTGSIGTGVTKAPPGDWTQFAYDAQRSGVGPARTGITTRNVRQLRIQEVRLSGTVDSSVIELHAVSVGRRRRDVFVMTTTYGRTIALDAATGARLWQYVPPDVSGYEGGHQITNATPIADPGRAFVYAASPDGMVRKLRLSDGHEVRSARWPVRVTFDASREKIAGALNISGRSLIVTTGGYNGDAPTYQGHVVLIARSSGRITAVWNSLCSNRRGLIDPPRSCPVSDSAIWARAGAVVEPGSGRILLATGNGPWNGVTNWGDSVLELSRDGGRLLQNWTPTNQARLEASDADIGSTAPAVLPTVHGVHLAVQGGKDGVLRLLDLDRLNGTGGGPGRRLGGELQDLQAPGGGEVFTAPVVWSHNGRVYVFVANGAGTAAYVLQGTRLAQAWHKGTAGTSPVLAGGLLYAYDPNAGVLNVRRPTSGSLIASLPAAPGHWNSPVVVGGRIALPVGNANDHSTSGTLFIYRLP